MRVLLDDNVPGMAGLLRGQVEVTAMNGRDITPALAAGFDALLCRSQTFVNAAMLDAAPQLRFVATATSGTDHVATDLLAARGVRFASAHGSNAVSVADYVLAALALHCLEQAHDVRRLRVGVVGRGAVGRVLIERLGALGCTVLVSDPPLASRDGGIDTPLAALADCDVVSLHVPLVDAGPWPTRNLINAQFVAACAPGTLLVNAARGGVVDEAAWCGVLDAGRHAVVDTWHREPRLSRALATRARIATSHIAGHSLDAKILGTRMVASAFAQFAGLTLPLVQLRQELPAVTPRACRVDTLADVYRAVLAGYAIEADDRTLRSWLPLDDTGLAASFDRYRREYPVRRDFAAQPLTIDGADELAQLLGAFGFMPGPAA